MIHINYNYLLSCKNLIDFKTQSVPFFAVFSYQLIDEFVYYLDHAVTCLNSKLKLVRGGDKRFGIYLKKNAETVTETKILILTKQPSLHYDPGKFRV